MTFMGFPIEQGFYSLYIDCGSVPGVIRKIATGEMLTTEQWWYDLKMEKIVIHCRGQINTKANPMIEVEALLPSPCVEGGSGGLRLDSAIFESRNEDWIFNLPMIHLHLRTEVLLNDTSSPQNWGVMKGLILILIQSLKVVRNLMGQKLILN